MGKSFRFLFRFVWINLSAILGFAAIIILGCYATGVPGNAHNGSLFETYYAMYPIMMLFMLYIYAFALCTSNLNLGLSFGARRRDFFWAVQGVMVCAAAICWALQLFVSAFPAIAGWEVRSRWMLLEMFDGRPWLFPLGSVVFMVLGCLSGLLMTKRRGLGIFLITVSVVVLMGATMVLILSSEIGFIDILLESGWGWLIPASKALVAALAVAAAGGELLIWRTIQRYTVR